MMTGGGKVDRSSQCHGSVGRVGARRHWSPPPPPTVIISERQVSSSSNRSVDTVSSELIHSLRASLERTEQSRAEPGVGPNSTQSFASIFPVIDGVSVR